MWPTQTKSDQRSNPSERRVSGSSAAPNPEQTTELSPKDAGTNLQEQEPQALDQELGQERQPSLTPEQQDPQELEVEQRDENESQASGPAGSTGSGVFGTLKWLGGGLGQQITQTVKSVPGVASKPASILKGLSVREGGDISGPDGNIIGQVIEGGEEAVGGTVQEGGKIVNDAGEIIGQAQLTDKVKDTVDNVSGIASKPLQVLKGLSVREGGEIPGPDGNVIGQVVEGGEEAVGGIVEEGGKIVNDAGEIIGQAQLTDEVKDTVDNVSGIATKPLGILKGLSVREGGEIPGHDGNVIGQVVEGGEEAVGGTVEEGGKIVNNAGEIIGQADLTDEVKDTVEDKAPEEVQEGAQDATETAEKTTEDATEDPEKAVEDTTDDAEKTAEDATEDAEKTAEDAEDNLPPISSLEGLTCNKAGKIIDSSSGMPIGELVEGDPKKLSRLGSKLDAKGQFWDSRGNVIGKAKTVKVDDFGDEPAFAGLEGLHVVKDGFVEDEAGQRVGKLTEGDAKKLIGRPVDEDGDVTDQYGSVKGHAEPYEEPEEEEPEEEQPEEEDLSILEGKTVNKAGKIVDSSGKPIGELVEGDAKQISRLGSKLDDKGQFWDSRGNVIGKAKTIKAGDYGDEPPFAGLEGLHVVKDGFVEDEAGQRVGKLTEGDAKKLIGRPVDEDGDVTDQYGSVKGHAEPYEEPEEEPEEEDLSILEGKTVNKAGNVVDEQGKVYGRITSGDGKRLAGRKVDGKGQIWGDDGKVIGKAELIPGGEQEKPEGSFYGFENITVGKDGVVQDGSGRVIGRVVEGDAAKLSGRKVDEDGDILDKNGNTLGRAERWEPEEKKREVSPMAGRKVTREGEVRDTDGNLIGKLTSGNLSSLVGKEIDDNGYVVDNDGNKIGECTLLENIPEPEPEPEEEPEPEGPSPEELEAQKKELEAQKKEQEDRDLAKKMSSIVSGTLDRVEPICKMITEHVDRAERTPKDELDEEQLVKDVKPLLEEAGGILQECNGAIRALDPDGRIAATAKARAASHEASPEEYALADKLKELTNSVVKTIENGKKKVNGMPKAKKELNPLWGLLSEPLFQIIAAVGLLLTGVLGLVGRLLDGLGLGSLVRGLLGGLGLDKLLGNLGLTTLTDSLGLTGKKK